MPQYQLGCAVTSRHPIVKISPVSEPPFEPWRVVAFSYGGVDVYGVYVPAAAPAIYSFWDWLLAMAPKLVGQPVLLLGDFNTGVGQEDSATYRFAAHDQFVKLKELGFVDVWRQQYPAVRDYTWFSSAGNGFKLDHALASPAATKVVQNTWLDHAPRLSGATDHSAVVLSLNNIH
jgi:exonuclease III